MSESDPELYVIALRTDATAWRKERGPKLTPSDPYLDGLDEKTAREWVEQNWALRSADRREMYAFYNGELPPFDPTALSVDGVKDAVRAGYDGAYADGQGDPYRSYEIEALIDAEQNGSDRQDVVDFLEGLNPPPQSRYRYVDAV